MTDSTDFELYELNIDLPIEEFDSYSRSYRPKSLALKQIKKGRKFIKVRKSKDKLVVVPWPRVSFIGDESFIKGRYTCFQYQESISEEHLDLIGTVTEKEVAENPNHLISNVAKVQKLRRLLQKGPVEFGAVESVVTPGRSLKKCLCEKGAQVFKKHCGEYSVRVTVAIWDGSQRKIGIKVSTIKYDSIRDLSPEEALTCDNEDIRLLTVDQGKAFSKKIKDSIVTRFKKATKGLTKTDNLVNAVVKGSSLVPVEIGRVSRSARKQAVEKIKELVTELEIEEKFSEFRKALITLQERAPEEVSKLFTEE